MHVRGDFMCGEVHRGDSNDLVLVFFEPTDGRRHVCTGGEEAIFLFMDFDIDRTCGLDGNQVLPGVVL